MSSYVARPHVLADEFIPGYLGDSFGLLPFVHGDPLTSQFDSPPRAFEGTGGSLAGAFLHKQFMQGRRSWRHAMTAGTTGARTSPARRERVPFFNFDF